MRTNSQTSLKNIGKREKIINSELNKRMKDYKTLVEILREIRKRVSAFSMKVVRKMLKKKRKLSFLDQEWTTSSWMVLEALEHSPFICSISSAIFTLQRRKKMYKKDDT